MDRFTIEGKGEMTAKMQDLMALYDSLTVCKFVIFGGVRTPHILDWIKHTTGWDITTEEMLRSGERIFNIKRLINMKYGMKRQDDAVSRRILTHKRGEGGSAEHLPDLEPMLDDYYEYRGWDVEGVPTEEKLDLLGITR